MKCLLILVFWTSVINSIRGQETCVPTGDGNYFAGTYTNTPINDNEEGVIAVITVIGLIDVDAPSHDYLIVTWSTGEEEITISLTDEFANYERNTATTSTPNIQLQMDLLCGGSPLIVTFRQNIVDINNHEPVFDYSEYTYKLPTPFPAGVEITQLGLEIIVTDLDITNDAINFDIDSPDLDVVYYGTTDSLGKNHKAVLVPKRPLEFTSTQTFLLTATDVGEPTQSSTATIIIEIDEENSVAPTPAFSNAYYEVDYVDSETISLGISNANSDDTCNLSGDYKNYFRCEIEENQVQLIRLLGEEDPEDLEEGGYRVIVVEVAASEVRVARTVVILQLPEIIITTTACPTETTITTTACEVCEVCTTPEPQVCTTTEIITTECPIVTCEPCASTTVCPTTLDPDELTTTACPELDCSTCPTTPNSCEVCTTTVAPDCPTTAEPDCSTCPVETTECPTTEEPDCSTCPVITTECPTTECPTTECPETEEPDCSTCPVDTTECPETEEPDCSTCPVETTECPTTEEPDCSTCPVETTECSETEEPDCSTCPVETTECPTTEEPDCSTCPVETTECPETEEPDCSTCPVETTECPTTEEPDCSTCPVITTDCPSTTTENCLEVCSELPPDCTLCPTSPPDSCSTDCDCPTTECDTENPVTSPETDCSSCTTEICEDYVCRSTTAPSVVSPCDCDCPTNATEICEEYVCRSTTAPSVVSPCDCDCTTSAEIECPEYTTPSPVEAEVSFIQETFTFSLSANEEMSQHYLPLSATSTINETITYQSEDLPSQLNLDVTNGMLTNNQPLPALIYQFSVTAVGQTSSASATATVIISVASLEVCEDGSIAASYSLLVNSVLENNEMDLLTTGFESEDIVYRFEISNVSPAAGESLFSVSPDGQTITCDELDRESSHFDDIDATQYTLTINIVSNEDEPTNIRQYRDSIFRIPSRTSPHTRATTRADSAQCILIEDIRNSATQTVLVVVVEDVNDNPPLFSPTNMVVGYPTTSLLSVIAPPYLVQVEATDADSGVNAELAYYVDNSLVTIHSTSGVVYPTDGLSDTDFTFTVTARDQNGAGLPSSNSLEVEVKILQQEHISVLTVTNALLEDVTEKLSELNIIANVNIKQLQASVLPTQNTRQTRADENYYLVIIVYALDGTNNLVTSQTLQGLLENVVGLSIGPLPDSNSSTDPPNITDPPSPTDPIDPTDPSTPTDPPNDTDGSDDPGSNTGLIAAVCVLSILLFLLLVGFAVFFYFKLRKNKSYNHMEEEDRQSSTPPQFKKNVPMGRSSSKLSYLGSDTEKAERRPTGILITNPISDPDEDSLPDSPPKERRKSVAFNSNVEQINIVTTREADDSIESSKL